jgi:hypothetical protein
VALLWPLRLFRILSGPLEIFLDRVKRIGVVLGDQAAPGSFNLVGMERNKNLQQHGPGFLPAAVANSGELLPAEIPFLVRRPDQARALLAINSR